MPPQWAARQVFITTIIATYFCFSQLQFDNLQVTFDRHNLIMLIME